MSTVPQLFVYRPRPGQLPSFMKTVARGTKIINRDGGKVRLWNTASGGEPGTIMIGIENTNYKTFGEYPAKLEADPEWRAFLAEIEGGCEPAADLVSSSMLRRAASRPVRNASSAASPPGQIGSELISATREVGQTSVSGDQRL